jgi:hypothetical protein
VAVNVKPYRLPGGKPQPNGKERLGPRYRALPSGNCDRSAANQAKRMNTPVGRRLHHIKSAAGLVAGITTLRAQLGVVHSGDTSSSRYAFRTWGQKAIGGESL